MAVRSARATVSWAASPGRSPCSTPRRSTSSPSGGCTSQLRARPGFSPASRSMRNLRTATSPPCWPCGTRFSTASSGWYRSVASGYQPPEEIHVDWRDLEKPIDRPSGKRYKIIVDREPIPIILLPGIMGTRLRQSASPNRKIWDPDDKAFMVKNYGTWKATALRKMSDLLGPKRVYDAGYLQVDNADDKHNKSAFDNSSPGPIPMPRRGGGEAPSGTSTRMSSVIWRTTAGPKPSTPASSYRSTRSGTIGVAPSKWRDSS